MSSINSCTFHHELPMHSTISQICFCFTENTLNLFKVSKISECGRSFPQIPSIFSNFWVEIDIFHFLQVSSSNKWLEIVPGTPSFVEIDAFGLGAATPAPPEMGSDSLNSLKMILSASSSELNRESDEQIKRESACIFECFHRVHRRRETVFASFSS